MVHKKSKMFLTMPSKKRYWFNLNGIKTFFREIRWAFQRMKYGYSECDVWNIDSYFLQTIVPMLEDLQRNGISYPGGITFEGWKDILDDMIYHFLEGNEDTCSKTIKDFKDWCEYNNYINTHLNKGFELFIKYFRDLWD